jgi:hypothetical protein
VSSRARRTRDDHFAALQLFDALPQILAFENCPVFSA